MTPALKDAELITRREAVMRVTALLGGVALVGGSALLTGCRDKANELTPTPAFAPEDVAYLDEIAETILPATSTPGAKAANTGAFMALMVTDTYSKEDQQRFRDGMRLLDEASKKTNGSSFMTCTPEQRLALLRSFDAEQKAHSDARQDAKRKEALAKAGIQQTVSVTQAGALDVPANAPAHWFRMMKELALLGYFTSEIGCTKAQRYLETPGKFEPCLPYVPGTPSWAGHA